MNIINKYKELFKNNWKDIFDSNEKIKNKSKSLIKIPFKKPIEEIKIKKINSPQK